MIIDSDDEGLPSKRPEPYINDATFEDDEEEYNPREPYLPIIQDLDLPLGAAVLHLSFPQLPRHDPRHDFDSFPRLPYEKLVVAISCSDFSIRLVILPLTPPSLRSKARLEVQNNISLVLPGHGIWGEQVFMASGTSGHQSLPKGISMTFTPQQTGVTARATSEGHPGNEMDVSTMVISKSPGRQLKGEDTADHGWDLLVASHSSDLSGLLLVHRFPISADGLGIDVDSADYSVPWRSQMLPSPAVSIQLCPSTQSTIYPRRVLVAEGNGPVKLFDCDKSSWLISLHPGLEFSSSNKVRGRTVLDTKWVLGGKAILVLLSDGEWGIWDFAPVGPGAKRDTDKINGISGGIPTSFSLGGWIRAPSATRSFVKSSKGHSQIGSKLAPMTPGTRKARQEALFEGSHRPCTHALRGGISVYPSGKAVGGREDDETVLLWHGDTSVIIPSLLTHWQNKIKGSGNLFGTSPNGQTREINIVGLNGEFCSSVVLFLTHEQPLQRGVRASSEQDLLVTGERSLVVLAAPLVEPSTPAVPYPRALSTLADQQLLARGKLDVNGMDRILNEMSNGKSQNGVHQNGATKSRKVGFASSS